MREIPKSIQIELSKEEKNILKKATKIIDNVVKTMNKRECKHAYFPIDDIYHQIHYFTSDLEKASCVSDALAHDYFFTIE